MRYMHSPNNAATTIPIIDTGHNNITNLHRSKLHRRKRKRESCSIYDPGLLNWAQTTGGHQLRRPIAYWSFCVHPTCPHAAIVILVQRWFRLLPRLWQFMLATARQLFSILYSRLLLICWMQFRLLFNCFEVIIPHLSLEYFIFPLCKLYSALI